MKGRLGILAASLLVSTVLFAPLMGKSFRFRLTDQAKLYAIELQAGEYELRVFDEVASIYQGKKLVAVANIEIKPLDGAIRNSTFCCDGILKEVRLKDKRVLFVEPVPVNQTGG